MWFRLKSIAYTSPVAIPTNNTVDIILNSSQNWSSGYDLLLITAIQEIYIIQSIKVN